MRVSPQKARLVLDLIKGRRVEDALNTLAFTKKRVAPTIEKLLRSAVENANYLASEKNIDVDVDNLYVKRAIANDGPRMKRIRPAPMGRAYRYQRRLTHIVLSVAEREGAEGLVTKVEEPAAPIEVETKPAAKTTKAAKPKAEASRAKKAAPKAKAKGSKAGAKAAAGKTKAKKKS